MPYLVQKKAVLLRAGIDPQTAPGGVPDPGVSPGIDPGLPGLDPGRTPGIDPGVISPGSYIGELCMLRACCKNIVMFLCLIPPL